ncbi:MAG: undecaprenyldiphospho-muramoylpentapeptide beta-N-acetylglucosaminyltransferase [Angelakisella sp.]|nr:undecaprenyldiphospho-muramoylpentapeptide beta-N-acetylglucosaminyltransferase [Angelakisella sp.]
MKVLFACGGTAGHINPGLSIAAALGSRCPDIQIRFAGNPDGMEARLVPGAGFEFVPFRAMGIQRRLTPYNIYRNAKSVCLLLTAQARAKKVIRAFEPDLVVGTGGYVSGPILLTAAKIGIPTATHEQNAFPGVTTKLLAKQVDKVLLAVEKAKEYLPKEAAGKCIVTGNPVRPEILTERREEARRKCGVPEGKLCILSFGGSLGAQRVNEAVADVMAWHIKEGKLHHIHATGQYGVELLPRLLQERKVPYSDNPCLDIREYIDDMPACLAAADLVICRAGASTLSELAAAGRASILIPSPNVAENHQYHNAMVLQNAGAAVVLQEKELTGEALVKLVKELTQDPARLRRLGENAKKIAAPRAVEEIADQLLALVQK